jgi:FkbM family methyltransferase
MIPHEFIEGPLGPFAVPSGPPNTKRVCIELARGVWGSPGSYGRPEARVPEYESPHLPNSAQAIIDIGAGWGAFAVWAWKRFNAEEINCYEPNRIAVDFVKFNTTQLYPKVHTVTKAVSVNPSAVLDFSDDWGLRSTSRGNVGEPVEVIHPKDLPACNIIKCDAEGIEPEVFATYPFLDQVDAAIYEWHSLQDRAILNTILQARAPQLACVRDENGPWGDCNGVCVWVRK